MRPVDKRGRGEEGREGSGEVGEAEIKQKGPKGERADTHKHKRGDGKEESDVLWSKETHRREGRRAATGKGETR